MKYLDQDEQKSHLTIFVQQVNGKHQSYKKILNFWLWDLVCRKKYGKDFVTYHIFGFFTDIIVMTELI